MQINRTLQVNFRKICYTNMDYLQQLYYRLFGTNPEDLNINGNSNNNNGTVNNSTTNNL